ncbi:hypothetical protein E4U32_007202 [Claviceps aff. humidiphila group G2b]|nr:hypothetical protein E4U32_007202 [Claviceps aff. humidiphila group G2b]
MDPQHWHRTIKDNPIAHGLDRFHSEARRIGVRDSADVDRVIEEDVRALAIELVFCLRIYAADVIRGSVSDDVVTVFKAVVTDSIGDAAVRRLLKAAITKADEKTLWDEVLTLAATLTATHTATRPPAPRSIMLRGGRVTTTQISTPSINVSEHHSIHGATTSPGSTVSHPFLSRSYYTTDYVTSSEYSEDINLLLKHKLKGSLDIDTPGFLDTFFPSRDYQQTAEKFLDRSKAGVVPAFHNGWDTWPDGAVETEVTTWLKLVTDKLEEFSRASFSSDVSHRRSILEMPRKKSRSSLAMPELDVAFVSAEDLQRDLESLRSSWSVES